MDYRKIAEENTILKVITGSHLYGTNVEGSDDDYQGIFMPSKDMVLGMKVCEQVVYEKRKDGFDYTCFSLIKYIHLASGNNPNILSIFYTPKHCIQKIDDFGKMLIESRDLFISKKAYHSFRGYAHAQKAKLLTKNPIGSRKDLIEKYGYDVKFGMHLIRLLYELLDILTCHEIVYPSPHVKYMKKIRLGEISLEEVLAEAVRLENLVDQAYAVSSLQHGPDLKKIEDLQISMLELFWERQLDQDFKKCQEKIGW